MQNQNRASLLKLTSYLVLSMLTMLILFSCSKDSVENPGVNKNEASTNHSSQSNGNSTTDVPYDETLFVPCANVGAGEYVHLTGIINVKYQIAWTDHGFLFGYHANLRQVEGVGLTSGETFSGSGVTNGNVHGVWDSNQWISNYSDRFTFTSQTATFYIKNSYHVSIDEDGEAHVVLDKQEIECN